jgi:hypothetical protein
MRILEDIIKMHLEVGYEGVGWNNAASDRD